MQPVIPSTSSPCYAILQAQWVNGGGDALPLTRLTVKIGRAPENDIVVEHKAVSAEHLEIAHAPGGVYVRDLDSTNGTFLDGQRLPANQPVPVQPGQTIRLAGCLDLRLTPPAPSVGPWGAASLVMPEHAHLLPRPQSGLVIWQRDGRLMQIALEDRPLKLGRLPDNDIVIDNRVVSGQHAEIIPSGDGRYQIVDLNSRNGLLHNGQRVKSKPLRPGDLLQITDQVMIQYRPDLGFVTHEPRKAQVATTETRLLDLQARKMIRVGRAPDNDMPLDDGRVSSYHAVIERIGMRYRIRDLRSHNGTFVNGNRVEKEQFISEGDTINIASVKFRFAEDGLERMDTRSGLRLDVLGLRKEISGGKNLLQDISLSVAPREFVALVGTSGAGKSTLLDAMNGFRPATAGRVLINGVDLYQHFDAYRADLGYVPQDDIMHRELTIYEALDYAARLRMPPDTAPDERAGRIKQVLRELELEQRKDLPINKLSGGQRKRVSIGIELLTRPRLFFLDEATSGLDPGTELELMKLLRHLTEDPSEGRTIVLITHATKNVMLCDNVIFLAKGGYLAFYGPPDQALKYFEQYRRPEDRRLKPDFEFDDIYGLLDPGKATSEKEQLALAAEWAERYRRSPFYQQYVVGRLQEQSGRGPAGVSRAAAAAPPRRAPRVSTWSQFWTLSARYWSVMRRDPKSLAILLLQAPLIGLFSFVNFGQGIFDRVTGSADKALTALFLAVIIVLLFGTVNSAREITKEIPVYKRERMVNLRIGPYIGSKVFVGALFCLYQVAVYLAFTLITIDWPHAEMTAWSWTQLYLTLVLASLSGAMMGLLLSALSSNDGQAVALIPVILIPQFIFAGILMPSLAKVPVLPQVATSHWAMEALATITHADWSGSEDPKIAADVAKEKARVIEDKIKEAVEKAVAERLEAQVREQLPKVVKQKTDQIIADETQKAQSDAEAAVLREMSKQLLPPPQAERDKQVAKARQQAAEQVAAKRPEIEAKVRAEAEGPLRAEIAQRIRTEAEQQARKEAAQDSGDTENPVIKGTREHFGNIFEANVYADWAAMTAILVALLAIILVLQKRKDVI